MHRRSFLQTAALALAAPALRAADPAPIRAAQIGTAHSHASGKMQAMRALPDLYQITGIAEPDEARRASAARAAAYRDLPWRTQDEILADPAIVAVAIETTLADSTPAAHAAIRAGKHIHLDKPGGADHPAFVAMRTDAEQRGLTVQMGYMLRYNPAFEILFRAAREGWLGTITGIEATMGKLADDRTRAALLAHPGHGMFELACHVIDAVVTLLGKPTAIHPFARSTRRDALQDNQFALLEYPAAFATITCNHADPFGGPHRRFAVTGTRGAIEIAPLESCKGRLFLDEARGDWRKGENPIDIPQPSGRYDGEFRDLARIIRGEKKLAWDATHDIAVHHTALRAAGL